MSYPTLEELNMTLEAIIGEIIAEIKALPTLKEKLAEAKAQLQASPYADSKSCRECGGYGFIETGGRISYDEYEYDQELCDHCVMEGVYAWDTNRSWFDQEAAEASLDPTLDGEEREDALHELLREQACLTKPQVIVEFEKATRAMSLGTTSVYQYLQILKQHLEGEGKDTDWVKDQLALIDF